MRLCLIGKNPEYVLAYRGSLIRAAQDRGHEVHAITGLAPNARAGERLAAAAVTLHQVPLEGGGTNPFRDLRAVRAMIEVLRSLAPHGVFCYNPKGIAYGPVAARRAGVPRVAAMVTGLGYAFTGRGLRRTLVRMVAARLYRRALSRCDTVFFQNRDDLAMFRTLGIAPDESRIRMLPGSGVDLDHFSRQPVPSGAARFLMISRILRDKGAVEFVEAARLLRRSHPDARCTLLGGVDDNPTAVPRAEIDRWRREGIVELPGEVEDVRPALVACSVFVLPSYREGTSKVMLEAMSTGRAVITTDAVGCREPIEPGVNGLLVPVADSAALADAMSTLAADPARRERMGRESRRIAESRFDARVVDSAILESLGL